MLIISVLRTYLVLLSEPAGLEILYWWLNSKIIISVCHQLLASTYYQLLRNRLLTNTYNICTPTVHARRLLQCTRMMVSSEVVSLSHTMLHTEKEVQTEYLHPFLPLVACCCQWGILEQQVVSLLWQTIIAKKVHRFSELFFCLLVSYDKDAWWNTVCRWHKQYKQSCDRICMIVVDSWCTAMGSR